MDNLHRPVSIFLPIKPPSTTNNIAGKKDKVTKLDEYLSPAFLKDYFSKK